MRHKELSKIGRMIKYDLYSAVSTICANQRSSTHLKRLITADTNTRYYTHHNENEILHKVTKGKLNDHC